MKRIVEYLHPSRFHFDFYGHFHSVRKHGFHNKPALAEQLQASEEKKQSYLVTAFWSGLFALVITHFWPDLIEPLSFMSPWHLQGSLSDWLHSSWPVFAWGAGFTALMSVLTRNDPARNRTAEINFINGFFTSVFAGVMEEVSFRWLIFLSSIIMAKFYNAFFPWAFGFTLAVIFMAIFAKIGRSSFLSLAISIGSAVFLNNWIISSVGAHVPEYLQVHVFGPIANWFTLGLLESWLLTPSLWHIGAGMLAANGAFRDGHKYLGLIGFLNAWFIGMFFFYLMFTYGLVAAIVVHFLYDALIFFVRYLDEVIERAQGNR